MVSSGLEHGVFKGTGERLRGWDGVGRCWWGVWDVGIEETEQM